MGASGSRRSVPVALTHAYTQLWYGAIAHLTTTAICARGVPAQVVKVMGFIRP